MSTNANSIIYNNIEYNSLSDLCKSHGILLYDLDDLNELLKKYPNLRNKNNKYAIGYLSSELSLEIPMVATFEDEDLNYFSMQLIHSSDVVELFVIRNHKEESSLPPNGTEVKLDIGFIYLYPP